jgi:hypothetical protein
VLGTVVDKLTKSAGVTGLKYHLEINPKTTAGCLNNINRTLKYLRDNFNKTNPNNLMYAEDILKGDPTAICLVVSEIYIAFAEKIRELKRNRYVFFYTSHSIFMGNFLLM